MRILHVITSLQTGGAETLVVNLMPRFRALGHEVGVVVFNGQRTVLMERLERECPECRVYRLGTSYYNPWYIVKLARLMRQYDIVHTHNSSPQLFAVIANIVCRKRLVTTEHNTNNRKRGNWLLSVIDKWMYTKYDRIICISNQAELNLRNYIQSKQSTEARIQTILNGVDIKAIHATPPINDMKSGKFIVLMVAGFRPQKDQDTLIRAMALLPKEQYELWLVGDGERRHDLELIIDNLQLNDYVRLLGLRTDVPNILKAADVIVMSTHYEGLSLSNIEGMAAGKPFVASDVEGIHEVTAGYGILFPHEDADALASIIQRLHDDRQCYQEVADRCYERAQQFDISQMVRKYNDLYFQMMSEK